MNSCRSEFVCLANHPIGQVGVGAQLSAQQIVAMAGNKCPQAPCNGRNRVKLLGGVPIQARIQDFLKGGGG